VDVRVAAPVADVAGAAAASVVVPLAGDSVVVAPLP
jgi:hypothetical protein